MKVSIVGSTFTGNKGAAAMLESSIQELSEKFENIEFSVLSISPNVDKKLNPYKNVKVYNSKPLYLGLVVNPSAIVYRLVPPLRNLIKKICPEVHEIYTSKALLDQGGITFSDGREYFLIFNIATILPALVLGTDVIKVSQAMGPFKNPINRFFAKLLLPKVKLIISRGARTQAFLDELGLDNTKEGADYAFSLHMTDKSKNSAEKFLEKSNNVFNKNDKVVGISPSVVVKKQMDKIGKDYIGLTSDFINELIKNEYKVAIIPHSVRLNTDRTHNNDLPMSTEIYNNVSNKDSILLVDEELDSQELRYIIGKCDYFVASRFHAMISSLSQKVPTMVVGWSHKYGEVLDMFEMGEFVISYKDIDNKTQIDLFDKLIKSDEQIKGKYENNYKKVMKDSKINTKYITNAISE